MKLGSLDAPTPHQEDLLLKGWATSLIYGTERSLQKNLEREKLIAASKASECGRTFDLYGFGCLEDLFEAVEPYPDSAAWIIGFSNDNHIRLDIGISKGPVGDFYICQFHMIAKIRSTPREGGGERILMDKDTIEFVFANGSHQMSGKSSGTMKDFDEKAIMEKECFARISESDVAGLFKPSTNFPKVNYGEILSRSNGKIDFAVFRPTNGRKDMPGGSTGEKIPEKYTYELLGPDTSAYYRTLIPPKAQAREGLTIAPIAKDAYEKVMQVTEDEAETYCRSQNMRIPTARDLALYAQTVGAQGISETTEDGSKLVNGSDPSGKPDFFYFSGKGYQPPTEDLGYSLWSSSILPDNRYYTYYLNEDGIFYYDFYRRPGDYFSAILRHRSIRPKQRSFFVLLEKIMKIDHIKDVVNKEARGRSKNLSISKIIQ